MVEYDEKFNNVCDFYMITHKLKNLLRKGWIEWKVNSERIESFAEHIYGTQMLAFAINSEFNLGVDIEKVVEFFNVDVAGIDVVCDADLACSGAFGLEGDAVEVAVNARDCLVFVEVYGVVFFAGSDLCHAALKEDVAEHAFRGDGEEIAVFLE